VLILIVAASTILRNSSVTTAAPQDTTKSIEVDSVANLSQGGTSLSVAGTVESQTEATVRAEKSGEVTAVYRALGDTVSAGTVIAEIENDSERAAVLQAQGAVQAATAGSNVSQTTLQGAQGSAVTALLSAYAAIENAIRTDIDPMFSNAEGAQPTFNVQSSDSQSKIDAQNKRALLGPTLARVQARATTLSNSDDLAAELTKTESDLRTAKDFLDTVIAALNAGIATAGVSDSTIAAYKATANGARASVTSSLSAISAARQSLQTAAQNAADGSGAASASQAALTQAQGALAAARANLEKSIIRAPISGTINSLSLKLGDFIQMTSPVLTVANNRALEVIAYITASDAPRIAVGDKATVEGGVEGTITRIAPALDPLTKKIEVRIGLPSGVSTLVNGQSVVVDFEKAASTPGKPISGPITIPITALKIGSDNIVVFTVDDQSMLVPHEVTLGTLMGDRVEIKSGVTPDMQIVTDARGLQPGEKVIVKQ
jgi:RND family efflux transporter MFP subunit